MRIVRALADSAWRYYLEAGDFPTSYAGGPIPEELDVYIGGIGSGSSKYFSYSYYYQTEAGNERVMILATDRDVTANNRFGNIGRYFILYTKTPIEAYRDYTLQKMDDTWYRGYFHAIWTATGNEYKAGWPGSGDQ